MFVYDYKCKDYGVFFELVILDEYDKFCVCL